MKKTALLFALACLTASGAANAAPEGSAASDPAIVIVPQKDQTTAKASDAYFTGEVAVSRYLPASTETPVSAGQVTFSPGARTAWHTHPQGQLLIVTSGAGLVQQSDGPVRKISEGDSVWFPPGVKHWHGAAPDQAMSHIAIAPLEDGKAVTWMEKVTDAQYNGN